MSLRVALIAEGSGDLGSSSRLNLPRATVNEALINDELGPAHWLIRRAVAAAKGMPEDAVTFVAPLRLPTGRAPRGSDLLLRRNLARLVAYPPLTPRPDLIIVLIDEDGEADRAANLNAARPALPPDALLTAVAVREFEAWLISDGGALRTLDLPGPPPANPEQTDPRAAKTWLGNATAASLSPAFTIRCDLARLVDLSVLRKRSVSFNALWSNLVTGS